MRCEVVQHDYQPGNYRQDVRCGANQLPSQDIRRTLLHELLQQAQERSKRVVETQTGAYAPIAEDLSDAAIGETVR